MSSGHPAEERILKNLHEAIARLHDDVAAVELWTNALNSFKKPVPGYDPSHARHALPSGRGVGAASPHARPPQAAQH